MDDVSSVSTIFPIQSGVRPTRGDDSPEVVRALEFVSRCEQADYDSPPAALAGLAEREQRFELSLANHLKSSGLLCAVRAAIALSAPNIETISTPRLREELTSFSRFADDAALLELTAALVETAGLPRAHLSGEVDLSELSGWVAHLREGTASFARSRDISRREAIHHAHYALHFTDLCKLVGDPEARLDSSTRRAVMDIEEALKEFAVVGTSRRNGRSLLAMARSASNR